MAPIASRSDIDKFDGSNDFGLWKIKMEALLCSLNLEAALEQEDMTEGKSTEKELQVLTAEQNEEQVQIEKKAYSLLILSLEDKVLREVSRLKPAVEI